MVAYLEFHEGKACDAVIKYLEETLMTSRKDQRSPEKEKDEAPVELTCMLGPQLYAFEHTGIEPFSGYLRSGIEHERDFLPFVRTFIDALPASGKFEFSYPTKALQGLKPKQVKRILGRVAEWIKANVDRLPVVPLTRNYQQLETVCLPGVPFEFSFQRHPEETKGSRIRITPLIGDDLEPDRLSRLRIACNKKYPKLSAWKQREEARTVLILECNDIMFTSAERITDAIVEIERSCPNPPDEIYLVGSGLRLWGLWPIRVGSKTLRDLPGFRPWLINADTLVSVTER
jgi:hypothetical protein